MQNQLFQEINKNLEIKEIENNHQIKKEKEIKKDDKIKMISINEILKMDNNSLDKKVYLIN
jgi:hypothetical protein